MPFTVNKGLRIHYQIEGHGPPLMLHHGLGSSLGMFRRLGYTEALKKDYRLILMDARGHGASDKPHHPWAYRPDLFVEDVIALLDHLDIPTSHYFGYSLGGRVGFGLAGQAPERVRSLIIGCSHPFAEEFSPFEGVDGKDPAAFIAALERVIGERLADEMKALVLFNDLRALAAAAQPWPDMGDVLPVMTMPCLVFAGTADRRHPQIKKCAQQIPQGRFLPLAGLNHVEAFTRIDLVIPHIRSFLAKGLESEQ